ncbi:MAG TPA: tetratricopeptide repeat protein, partial [Pirellulales bacterium]|nr:tetratricopeptide repeat protein [Pirellulales bacterium]
NDDDAALDIINEGIAQYPNDSVMHEFRALVLFAKGDYQQAAATIHSVLAIGPGWDWTTLASMYTNVAIYSDQLRALEAFINEHPQDGAARFLLAYHYLVGGHADAAARQFQKVVTLVPGDQVAADLARMLSAPPAGQQAATEEQPAPGPLAEAEPAATPIDATALLGSWHAARDDGSKFELTLTKEATFTWNFSSKQQPAQKLNGTYTVEDNVLALECNDGGSLIGKATPDGAKEFNFTLVGAPPEDKGLDFSR